ncbi:MAG: hypothetical protein PHT33_10055 [bacterium]|nr:hypothetical protein [bacterium]
MSGRFRLLKLLGVILLSGLLFSPVASAGGRNKEAGVVDYFSKYNGGSAYQKRMVKDFYEAVRGTSVSPEWVDVDIFLPENKAKRDEYKRIAIPASACWFTQKMFEGMEDYVKSGGLLITNSSLVLLDKDNSYDVTSKTSVVTNVPTERFLGVDGTMSTEVKRIKVQPEMDCPLTQGLEKGAWIDLQVPMFGRVIGKVTAEKAIISDYTVKGNVAGEQPFLTFKHLEKGACIYLVGYILTSQESIKDANTVQIFKNIFSAKTLDWLCAGDQG